MSRKNELNQGLDRIDANLDNNLRDMEEGVNRLEKASERLLKSSYFIAGLVLGVSVCLATYGCVNSRSYGSDSNQRSQIEASPLADMNLEAPRYLE